MKRHTEPTWRDGRCYLGELPGWLITRNGERWLTLWGAPLRAADVVAAARRRHPRVHYELVPWTVERDAAMRSEELSE